MSALTTPLQIGGIYWFVNPQINSSDPHPHVCVGNCDDKLAMLFCGTSNFDGKKRHFELNNIAHETLVRIQTNSTNSIKKDTYLNCNEVQFHSELDLLEYENLNHRGEISESEMFQIRNAVEISELLEADIQELILSQMPDFD